MRDLRKTCLRPAAICVLLACAGGAKADPLHGGPSQTPPNYTDLSDYLLPQNAGRVDDRGRPAAPGSGGNYSMIDQSGSYNRATADLNGAANRSVQLQYGFGNSSSIDISGANNNVGTNQVGIGNSVDLSVTGQNNTIMQSQIGANLSYSLNQVGSGKSITVQQSGSR